jgi:glycogen operon protein
MLKSKRAVRPGRPAPLGATWDGRGVNFALFSQHAEKVELCLFDKTGRRELERIPLPEYTDQVWHGYYGDLRPGVLYGYRVYGPYDPGAGHRFNANKLLVDPYARALHGALQPHSINFGYRFDGSPAHLSFDRRNNARYVPKCRVVEPGSLRSDAARPGVPWQRTLLYELHVRGFTKRHPELPMELRGTFAGLGEPPVLEHLTRLGVTTVELLPVHPIVDGLNLAEAGLCNYWGYSSYNYFALEQRYLAGDDPGEFRAMVDRLHEAGIEVILDVVYNHTGEGNQWGPTLSFRGIDNASYYRLAEDRNCYIDDTGCGNTLNVSHPRVLQMVMDSLRYWAQEAGVDGFRFDLATTLARELHGFDPGSSFLDAVRQDPVLSSLKLIAEPWDLGPGGYQLGSFPPGWSEWNDKYRDAVRRYWRGDEGMLGEFAHRLSGSSDIFEHDGRRPWSSINFVTSHDGFTLEDLVSYDHKHNEANLEGNADGSNHHFSWNCGVEGAVEDSSVLALRARQKRNMLTTLLFSVGVPMLVAGDEFGRQQQRLLPGQRDQLGLLGQLVAGHARVPGVRANADLDPEQQPGLSALRLLQRKLRRRRADQGRDLAQPRRPGADRGRLAPAFRPLPGRPDPGGAPGRSGRSRAPPPRSPLPAAVQCRSRAALLHPAAARRGRAMGGSHRHRTPGRNGGLRPAPSHRDVSPRGALDGSHPELARPVSAEASTR